MTSVIATELGLEEEHTNMCSLQVLLARAEDTCELARKHCESESIFNFYEMYFCTMGTNNWLFYPVAVSVH